MAVVVVVVVAGRWCFLMGTGGNRFVDKIRSLVTSARAFDLACTVGS